MAAQCREEEAEMSVEGKGTRLCYGPVSAVAGNCDLPPGGKLFLSGQPDSQFTQHSWHKWYNTLTHFEPPHIIFLRTYNLNDEKRHKYRRY